MLGPQIGDKDKNETENDLEVLNKSTSGASFLMLAQISTKLLTFLLNQLLIRFISPKVFGIASYLEFISSTILFFSREAERLAIQRTESNKNGNSNDANKQHKNVDNIDNIYREETSIGTLQSIINFGYIPMMVGIPLSCIFFYWQFRSQIFQDTISLMPYYQYSVGLIWVSIMLELSIEPLYAINQYKLNFKKRSKYESISVFSRCATTFVVIATISRLSLQDINYEGIAVLAFSLGQFSYSFCTFSFYHGSFIRENNRYAGKLTNSLICHKIHTQDSYYYFNSNIFKIWKIMFVQMIFKQLLTEGDKLLINYLCTIEEQGVYSVVTNYGSIIARLVFQPIEESMRILFAKMLINKSKENVGNSFKVMQYVSIFYLNLSILIALGGVSNASFLLKFLLGGKTSKWGTTDIAQTFPQYIAYIPFLAFNGILEAFFSSVANEKNIKSFSIFMSISTLVILGLSYILIAYFNLALTGLIVANATNMLLRISYCTIFIKTFYSVNGIQISFISIANRIKYALLVGLTMGIVQRQVLGKAISSNLVDLFKSAGMCFICLGALLYLEKDLLKRPFVSMTNKYLGKRKGKLD